MNQSLFQKIKEMHLPYGKYALFGSAPLGIRGLKECRDIDIIVTADLWDEYKAKGWEQKIMPSGSQYLNCEGIELWRDWWPGQWDINKLIAEAEIIEGLPFVKLEDVLKWKNLIGREKDLKDIGVIEEFLRTKK